VISTITRFSNRRGAHCCARVALLAAQEVHMPVLNDLLSVIKKADLTSFICEEKCRFCKRAVPAASVQESSEGFSERASASLCTNCYAEFLSNRQSLWWLPIENESGTTGDTIPVLPVATAGMYEGIMQKLIRRLKYDDDRLVVSDIEPLLTRALTLLTESVPDLKIRSEVIVVPIPLHWIRERKRGYNQAHLFCSAVGRTSGFVVEKRILRRVRKTKPQFGLKKQERMRNVSDAFALGNIDVRGKSIILVDDVFTSGATLTACASILTAGGAKSVSALAAARAPYDKTDR